MNTPSFENCRMSKVRAYVCEQTDSHWMMRSRHSEWTSSELHQTQWAERSTLGLFSILRFYQSDCVPNTPINWVFPGRKVFFTKVQHQLVRRIWLNKLWHEDTCKVWRGVLENLPSAYQGDNNLMCAMSTHGHYFNIQLKVVIRLVDDTQYYIDYMTDESQSHN